MASDSGSPTAPPARLAPPPRAPVREEFRVSFDVSGYTVQEMSDKARVELDELYAVPEAWTIKIDAEPMVLYGGGERVGPWVGRVSASMKLRKS